MNPFHSDIFIWIDCNLTVIKHIKKEVEEIYVFNKIVLEGYEIYFKIYIDIKLKSESTKQKELTDVLSGLIALNNITKHFTFHVCSSPWEFKDSKK